jgi:ribosomal protein L11 methyltransferase
MLVHWYALDIAIEPEGREAVEYALMEAGALGTETSEHNDRVTGYFEALPQREKVREELASALQIYNLPTSTIREMDIREIENHDWLAEWKNSWQPVAVGQFVISPPWTQPSVGPDQFTIFIEPGMAFGTGTHETTRLCLQAIQNHYEGRSFLDVGTGTGILAIAAAKLHPQFRVIACDTDAMALEIARENAKANGVSKSVEFFVGSVDESTPSADMVCANLTADVILPLLPTLIRLTCGRLVLSGILDTQSELIETRLRELGITCDYEITQDGEWVCFVV